MSYKPGDAYYGLFVTSSFTTGAATNADTTPVATATKNGADDSSFALTVTNLDTGRYKVTGTIPSGYVSGNAVAISVAATVGGVAAKGILDQFLIDKYRLSDFVPPVSITVGTAGAGGMTPISAASSYASVADLINAHDATQIGNWATDTRVTLTPTQLLSDTVVAAALNRASGEVEMACFAGGRYSPLDLQSLTGVSAVALKGLVADLAFYHLGKRRVPEPEKISGYEEARKMLEALREGTLIFGFQEAADAGAMKVVDIKYDSTGQVQRPSDKAIRLLGRHMDPPRGNDWRGTE